MKRAEPVQGPLSVRRQRLPPMRRRRRLFMNLVQKEGVPDTAAEAVAEAARAVAEAESSASAGPDRSMWAPQSEPYLSPAGEEFLARSDLETPFNVIDIDVARRNYTDLRAALPRADVFYAVKANPEAPLLRMLAAEGSSFDVASPGEVDMALATGVCPSRVSYGNTIKKERDIAYAFRRGVRLFAFDSDAELDKLARAAPGAGVFCRILTRDDPAAEWPLSRKFGCSPAMAERLLLRARELGLRAEGVSFHVGSQMTNPLAWDAALADAAGIFRRVPGLGLVNLGGGLPTRYTRDVEAAAVYGRHIMDAVRRHFGGEDGDDSALPRLVTEPGRSLAGSAGVIEAEVVLISRKEDASEPGSDARRWVYLDVGLFHGLAETLGESIKYRVRCGREGAELGPVVLAGPTCDSADIMYERCEFNLPLDLEVGDRVQFLACGAYTTTYSAVSFNGFSPLRSVCVGGAGDEGAAAAAAGDEQEHEGDHHRVE